MVFVQPVPRGRDGKHRSRILVLLLFAAVLREMRDMTKLTGDLAAPEWSFVHGPSSWTLYRRQQFKTYCHQIAKDVPLPTQLLSEAEVRHIHAAVRAKCLEAIAVGNPRVGADFGLGFGDGALESSANQVEGTDWPAIGRQRH